MIATTFGTPYRRILATVLAVLLATFGLASTAGAEPGAKPSPTVNQVKARGELRCGVSGFARGFSEVNEDGLYTGFDVDMCRAVAAAVLGDADAVEFVPLGASERFEALEGRKVDVLIRTTTNTFSRDTDLDFNFGPTIFYDGQSLMINPLGAGLGGVTQDSTIGDLPDATTICVNPGTTAALNIMEEADEAGRIFTIVPIDTFFDGIEKLIEGDCDVVTTDKSGLVGVRAFLADNGVSGAEDWVVLKQTISKEPLAPVVREGDDGWFDIVSWVINATVFADEVGITRSNIDAILAGTPRLEVSRAFGGEPTFIGLDADWAYQVIKQVGNYGEIYANNLEPIDLGRAGTLNDSYVDGGLLYSPPFR